jgi:putative endonuclease
MKNWHWYVYIIECLDGTFYTGKSWNVELRYDQHLSGFGSKYTAKHGVKRLAYYEMHENAEIARERELQIKGWSQEKKKRILIDNFHPEE